ncbi:unnamed protein product [Phytophthora fragariaefolia]|uniref:Unnamed protein product n=1 Tax=Phytophthora fragariaefolia TaxID=1490495 RepID=A0A9W6X4J8_9STRA|nr:unnamed protein product [Phytophthora fragariaefolia]
MTRFYQRLIAAALACCAVSSGEICEDASAIANDSTTPLGSTNVVQSSTASAASAGSNSSTKCFSTDFLFGSATASYQVEGAVNATGRTPSIWNEICGSDSFPSCANVADDYFHRYKDDIATMKNDGYGSMRFLISWSRVMTWNSTLERMQPNPEGLAFYHSMVDDLVASGIEPLLTLFHWDMPIELYDAGDFLNTTIIDHFLDYAELIFSEFGQQVKFWSTINEPLSLDSERCKNWSCALGLPYNESNEADVEAAERYSEFHTGWFLSPLTTGDYPAMMRERVGDRLPNFTDDQAALVKGSYDLLMINHYFANLMTDCDSEHSQTNCSSLSAGFHADICVDSSQMPPEAVVGTGSIADPTSCTDHSGFPPSYLKYIRWTHKFDTSSDILLTENGWCGNETIDNQDQLWYFRTHMEMVHKAIYDENIPIIGYTAWSFVDNYEWGSYAPRYGLYHVDFPDNIGDRDVFEVPSGYLIRTPRATVKWYANLATTGCFETDADDEKWLAYV